MSGASSSLAERLLNTSDTVEQAWLLAGFASEVERAELAAQLKDEAERLLPIDCERSLQVADLLCTVVAGGSIHALGVLARADALRNLGRFAEARAAYDAAAGEFEAESDEVGWARSRIGATYACRHTGPDAGILADIPRAAAILGRHALWSRLARLESATGYLLSEQGRTTAALASFDRALVAAARLTTPDERLEAEIIGNQAIAQYHLANYRDAERLHARATAIFERLGLTEWIAQSQSNVARLLAATGHYSRALAAVWPARRAYHQVHQQAAAAFIGQVGVEALIRLNRSADAAELASVVADEFEATGSRVEAAVSLVWRSLALAHQSEIEPALASLEHAEGLFGSAAWEAGPIAVRIGRAAVLESARRWPEALAEASAARADLAARGRTALLAQVDLVRARALHAMGEAVAARNVALGILDLIDDRGLPWIGHLAWRLLGDLARAEGRVASAIDAYAQAIDALEQVQGRILTEYRATFLADKSVVFSRIVQLLVSQGDAQRAFEYVERSRSRALVDALAGGVDMRTLAGTGDARQQAEELVALRREHDWLFGADPASPRIAELEQRIERLLEEVRLVGAADLERIGLLQGRVYSPAEYLDGSTLLIEYFAAGDDLLVFGLEARSVRVQRLAGAASRARRLHERLVLNVEAASAGLARQRALRQAVHDILHAAYNTLIKPIEAWLAGRTRLVIVPCGHLHHLPFAALRDPAEGRYLVERFELVMAPSASALTFCCRRERRRPERVLAVGHAADGALPHVIHEARAVAQLFGGECLLAGEATVANVLERARGSDVLHIAAHGVHRADAPQFSHLLLGDGELTALDCFEIALDGTLVTLSACESGRGVVGAGDEPIGLSRALLFAGARAVVQSLWRVDDRATRQLMERFYAGVQAGQGPGQALRAAQLDYLAQHGKATHPFDWAAFELIGDWRA